jgi:hypothetical protein
MDNSSCKHDACVCMTTNDSEYCSDHCKEAAEQDIIEIKCDCGHGGCS